MMTTDILREFRQLSIKQQLEMLKAALEIIESNFEGSQINRLKDLPLAEVDTSPDPLLALAGQFEATISDISDRHDQYIGENLKDNND